MHLPLNRRDFLASAMSGLAGLSLTSTAATHAFARQGKPTLATTKLADNIVQIAGAGGNVLAVTGTDGVLLVNAGLQDRGADLLEAGVGSSSVKRVQAVFNTDWRPENTGSNEMFRNSGAKVISHENTKLWLGTDILVEWENRTYPARPKNALPNQTFYTTGKMTFGKHADA